MTPQPEIIANGIRVVCEPVPYAHSIALGIWIDAGARDESDGNAGISHFIEHLLFKGTERRSARQIAEEFDAIGGQLNAVTDKEYTCYYAKVLPEHLDLALDVLADMIRNPLLDPEEFEREKNVILEEIKEHEDTPEDLVHDVFAGTLWPGHPLGRPVIGRQEVIASLTPAEVRDYLHRHYTPDRIIIAAAGKLDAPPLRETCERLLGSLCGDAAPRDAAVPSATHANVMLTKPAEQIHFCLGTRGCSQVDEERYALGIVDTALGGGMSSRLFQEVREKRGLCYSIGSYTASYREGGLFAVYASTSPENLAQVQELAREEMAAIAAGGLGTEELERAKNQIRGSVLLGLDSTSGRMTRLGKSLLYYNRVIPVQEVIDRIAGVTADDAARIARVVLGEGQFACAAIGPLDESTDD